MLPIIKKFEPIDYTLSAVKEGQKVDEEAPEGFQDKDGRPIKILALGEITFNMNGYGAKKIRPAAGLPVSILGTFEPPTCPKCQSYMVTARYMGTNPPQFVYCNECGEGKL